MSQLTLSIPSPDLAAMPMDSDAFTALRLFENHHGIDRPESWDGLLRRVHGAYEIPPTRTEWGKARLGKAVDKAEAAGLISYREDWVLTKAGAEARKAETVRRMRG